MHKLSRLAAILILSLVSIVTYAQDSTATGMNGVMRSNNKIYVVMAVCVTILIGLILYLIRIDRKVSKAEKQ
jgi:uncharacterized membrane protein